jgi:death on curing protein
VRDHPFVDGNKRVGLVACLVFLDMNGLRLRVKEGQFYDLVIRVAEGRSPKSAVSEFLRAHIEP